MFRCTVCGLALPGYNRAIGSRRGAWIRMGMSGPCRASRNNAYTAPGNRDRSAAAFASDTHREEIATLDVLSTGRVEFGFGRGSIPSHFTGFGSSAG